MTTTTPYLRWAAAAVFLLGSSASFAKDPVHSANAGVRSSQALPPITSKAYNARSDEGDEVSKSAAADPPYCSGNKYGLNNGEGSKHANGKPFTCGKSPG